MSNSPYSVPYNLCDDSLEDMELDQPIIPNWYFSLFSLFVCMISYLLCKEKFCLSHKWDLEG